MPSATAARELAERARHQTELFEPSSSGLRYFATGSRKRKRPAEPTPVDDECQKRNCVQARAERDQARAQSDAKVAKLQQLRSQLLKLATQVSSGDSRVGVATRAIQAALMEILA